MPSATMPTPSARVNALRRIRARLLNELVKAQFKVLRFQEDWSYLGDPEVESDLWLPETKWIEVADGWHLTAGGQFRWREENGATEWLPFEEWKAERKEERYG